MTAIDSPDGPLAEMREIAVELPVNFNDPDSYLDWNNLFDEYKQDLTDFLNGLELYK